MLALGWHHLLYAVLKLWIVNTEASCIVLLWVQYDVLYTLCSGVDGKLGLNHYCQRLRSSAAWKMAAYYVGTRRQHFSCCPMAYLENVKESLEIFSVGLACSLPFIISFFFICKGARQKLPLNAPLMCWTSCCCCPLHQYALWLFAFRCHV